jgi:hypothetical protein
MHPQKTPSANKSANNLYLIGRDVEGAPYLKGFDWVKISAGFSLGLLHERLSGDAFEVTLIARRIMI